MTQTVSVYNTQMPVDEPAGGVIHRNQVDIDEELCGADAVDLGWEAFQAEKQRVIDRLDDEATQLESSLSDLPDETSDAIRVEMSEQLTKLERASQGLREDDDRYFDEFNLTPPDEQGTTLIGFNNLSRPQNKED